MNATPEKPARPPYVYCPECGGYGGIDAASFGDRGWHPCYYCGETGYITRARMLARLREQLPAIRESRGWRKRYDAEQAERTRRAAEWELARSVMAALFPKDPGSDEIPF